MHRHIIHVHIPALRIALARIFEPCLRERPVAVAFPESPRARVLSISGEARKAGVFKGMFLQEARKCCPGLRVLPPDVEMVEQASCRMAGIAAQYTPLWEISRPGHIYLDLTGTQRLWGAVKDTAFCIREEIKGALSLKGTAGVASNKLVSHIASCTACHEPVLDVDFGKEAAFLAPLEVSRIPGIGGVYRKMLMEELNIFFIGQLAGLNMDRLRLLFGPRAPVIRQRALGIDPTPVYCPPQKPLMSEAVTLPGDENDDVRLLRSLFRLVERCAYRMRKRGLVPGKAGLLVRYADQKEMRRRIPLSLAPCMDLASHDVDFGDPDLYHPLESLFFQMCRRRVRVRLIKVWFWDFGGKQQQLPLFHAPCPDRDPTRRITRALDRIRDRYGEGAVRYGRAA
ncbi:MAG: DNA polymerase IV [Deltaproteobacteria bacterium]|nr:DNA polymerase IV [Deltaproteobacteria bacterium]